MLYLPQSPINIVSSSAVAADPGSLVLGAYDSAMTGKDIKTLRYYPPYTNGLVVHATETDFDFLLLFLPNFLAKTAGFTCTLSGPTTKNTLLLSVSSLINIIFFMEIEHLLQFLTVNH